MPPGGSGSVRDGSRVLRGGFLEREYHGVATDFPELSVLVQEIREAMTLESALRVLAGALDKGGFEPAHVALVGVEADGKFRILGVWAAVPTRFEAGQIISADATPAMLRNAERVQAGYPLRIQLEMQDFGLLGDLAKEEGIAGWVVAPVSTPSGVAALLTLGSASTAALDRTDLTRVHALATMLGHWMLRKPPRYGSD